MELESGTVEVKGRCWKVSLRVRLGVAFRFGLLDFPVNHPSFEMLSATLPMASTRRTARHTRTHWHAPQSKRRPPG